MTDSVTLVKVGLNELSPLQVICKITYIRYFQDHWRANGLDQYLEEQFGAMPLQVDLSSDTIDYFFITFNEQRVGYLKINYHAEFDSSNHQTGCELEKMYLLPQNKSQGIGERALNALVRLLEPTPHNILFLHVLDTNKKAIRFYEKLGFIFYSKMRLDYIHFKEDLKGLNKMYIPLKDRNSQDK